MPWVGYKDSDFLNYLIDQLPHYIFWKDASLVFRGCNKKFAEQFGYRCSKEVVGKTDADFPWASTLRDKYLSDDHKIVSTGVAKLDYEEQQKQFDGSLKTVLVSKVPIHDAAHKVIGVLGIYTDISDRKRAEQHLIAAKEDAEVASRAKDIFLSNMQHDLRTPSSGIAAMTKMLAEQEEDPEKKEILDEVAKASAQLLDLLNSVLTFSQVESATLPVFTKSFDMAEVLSNVVAVEKPYAKHKNLEIITHCSNKVPASLVGGVHRISRILSNLLSNAVKFTDKGFVKISIDIAKQVDNKHIILSMVVKDSGIGIPKNQQNTIYDRFTRLHPSNNGQYKGSGLGLSIVKQFLNDLDGEIRVFSELSHGTTFECFIPCALPLPSIKQSKDDATINEQQDAALILKVLLVEDDSLAQKVALMLLKKYFVNPIDVASTGQEALTFSNANKYDLILMDVGLPDISGYDVVREIRQSTNSRNKESMIVALTAHDCSIVQKDAKKAGMDKLLTKPLTPGKIQEILTFSPP